MRQRAVNCKAIRQVGALMLAGALSLSMAACADSDGAAGEGGAGGDVADSTGEAGGEQSEEDADGVDGVDPGEGGGTDAVDSAGSEGPDVAEGGGPDITPIEDSTEDAGNDVGTDGEGSEAVDGELLPDTGDIDDTDTDTGESPDPLDPDTVPLRGACKSAERLGGFVVESYDFYSIIDGRVSDGVNPIAALEDVGGTAQCRLLRKEFPFCDPPCQPGFTCDQGNTCAPFPKQQVLGTVSIEGLVQSFALEPKPPNNSYFDTKAPHPLMVDGAVVHLTSTAGWAGEMELFGLGSPPLELIAPEWTLLKGEPLNFAWEPAEDGARTHVHMILNIDQHGLSPVVADCEFPDTGSATVPASMIETLMDYGISGYPNARVSRRTADKIDVELGCIDFVVAHPRDPDISISGHYPCKTQAECPPPLVCNVPIETCQ